MNQGQNSSDLNTLSGSADSSLPRCFSKCWWSGRCVQLWKLLGETATLAGFLTNVSINPIAALEIRRHKAEWGSWDYSLDNPHRMGPENLSNLSERLLVEDWPWVEVSF